MGAPITPIIVSVPVHDIFVAGGRRAVSDEAVGALIESIKRIGLQTPLSVLEDDSMIDGGYALVAGAHRLEACKRLGVERVPVVVMTGEMIDAELWAIAENLHRADLTALQRDEQIARWVELTAEKARQVGAPLPGGAQPSEKGQRKAAKELGISENDARRANKVASLTDDAKAAAKAAGLDDNRTALLEAAKAEPSKQAAVIRDYAEQRSAARNKIDGDVKARAAKEVAEMLAEHVPGEWWDALKSNLYAAGAANIAHELTNITGQSIMDRRYGA